MFAAGNNARAALEGLLDRGASVSIRDRCAPQLTVGQLGGAFQPLHCCKAD